MFLGYKFFLIVFRLQRKFYFVFVKILILIKFSKIDKDIFYYSFAKF